MGPLEKCWIELTAIILRLIRLVKGKNGKKTVPPTKNPLLLTSATSLAAQIRQGKVKSEVVVRSYIERLREVQPYVNGLADDRFEAALDEAREADGLISSGKIPQEELAKTKPLLGVPFTVKIITAVEGLSWNAACKVFAGKKAEQDAEIVAQLKRKGGIVLGVSVMPELGLNPLAEGKLYGRAINPIDSRMFPGISSCGEAVLNASAATPFGLANDLFGSNRLPAYLCGLFCHRPTPGLLSNHGTFPRTSEKSSHIMTHGPICRYAEDLITVMEAALGSKAENMKIGKPVDFSKITFYFTHNFPEHSLVKSVDPEVLYTVQKVINHFKLHHGSPTKYIEIEELTTWTADIAAAEIKSGNDNSLRKSLLAAELPVHSKMEFLKSLIGKSTVSGLTALAYEAAHKQSSTYRVYPGVRSALTKIREKLDNALDGNAVLLYPTCHIKYMYTEEAPVKLSALLFTGIFSILQVPVSQCPVGASNEGLPLGLQVIANRFQDNLTLAVSLEIERAFGAWAQPNCACA